MRLGGGGVEVFVFGMGMVGEVGGCCRGVDSVGDMSGGVDVVRVLVLGRLWVRGAAAGFGRRTPPELGVFRWEHWGVGLQMQVQQGRLVAWASTADGRGAEMTL